MPVCQPDNIATSTEVTSDSEPAKSDQAKSEVIKSESTQSDTAKSDPTESECDMSNTRDIDELFYESVNLSEKLSK